MNTTSLRVALFLAAALAAHSASALTYVPGSLKDSNIANGNGVSSPSGATNIQYSDGSGTVSNYGQIDIADDPADPDWVYDQGSAQAISSVTFWSQGTTTTISSMPSGTITIFGSNSSTGPWSQIGQVNRSMVRDTILPNSQAVAGEGFRIPCNNSVFRYVRINVVTPGSTGGLDNHWLIRRVETNKNIVIHHFHRTSDGSSAINDFPRIPYNVVDGNPSTIWNPQSSDMVLTLDLGPTARRFQQIIFTPSAGEATYLPQVGEVRVSSNDDPDNMDTVVGLFNISYNNAATDGATIILPQAFKKRYVQIHWSKVRNSALNETRFAEIQVDTVPEKPVGQDLTSLGIDPGYMIVPNDPSFASTNVQHMAAALAHYKYVYLPAGTYYFNNIIYMPTDSRLSGAGDATVLSFSTQNASIRVEGSDFVRLDHFRFDRTVDNATEAGIYVYIHNGDVPFYTEIDSVTITNNRSRGAGISLVQANAAGITNCTVLNSQMVSSEVDQNRPQDGNFWYLYGSGINAGSSSNLYIANNHVEETRNMISVLPASPRKQNFLQAGGIEASHCQFAILANNYSRRYGNAFDINGSSYSWVISNTSVETSETGVKFCNGTNNSRAIGNNLNRCGLVGIWFSPGSEQLSAHHNIADGNTISEGGVGISNSGWDGSGFWLGYFSWSPAGICVDNAPTTASRCEYTTVTNNNVIATGGLKTPASTYSVYVNKNNVAPYMTTLSNNAILDGPKISAFQVNDGNAQRSKVTAFTLTFSGSATLASGAVTLKRRGDNVTPSVLVTNPSNDHKTFLLTVSGSGMDTDSLGDGVYDLTVVASKVTDSSSRPMFGGDKVYTFHRLFGDADGDKDVDATDNLNFLKTKNQTTGSANYKAYLDYQPNGTGGDATDTQQFRDRLGKSLSY